MTRFFLVHGAGHGAWCWEHLTPHLDRLGHTATAVDMPGMGADTTPIHEVSWASTVAKLLADLDSVDEPVIIAAHSMGGTLAAQLAECRPDKVLAVVYVAATLPRNGESCLTNVQEDISASALLLKPGPDQYSQEADVDVAKIVLWGGSPDHITEVAATRRRRQSVGVFAGTVTITEDREGRIPRFYVETLRDLTITPGQQRAMYTRRGCVKVYTLDSGHSPMLSMPDRLAECLDDVARRVAAQHTSRPGRPA